MSTSSSIHTFRRGEFRKVYRLLKRHGLLQTTPVIMCEGDSWFSTPLAMNLLDQIVIPTPKEEAAGKVWIGDGGLFFRAEKSGDTAINMFSQKYVDSLGKWYKAFDFDMVLLSAGGNDFVAEFLADLFKNRGEMTVKEASEVVVDSGRFEQVFDAYKVFISRFTELKPNIPIIAHTYDYPQLLGKPAKLTINNIGLIALFKKEIGDWIGGNIHKSLPNNTDKRKFAKGLIDSFVKLVLKPLAKEFNDNFSYVDLRGTLSAEFWFDEMHPTGEGFRQLAQIYKQAILEKLPDAKKT
ncbi:hypothetical protein MNBD_GAMMA01-909 [hydrothermal vent metagenome]|uniref:SGNH hydrolase-type esterase domain-containing protein n=1 Tax=hydrothermal vent metagenome TaxID=652676 RepID=A0A3B0V6B2_9ZZZZ